jgi:thymidine kinase
MAWADSLVELKSICHCGKKANMVVRVDQDGKPVKSGEQISIGGNESYIPMCRKHFAIDVWNNQSILKVK